jgi:hypothetical protein
VAEYPNGLPAGWTLLILCRGKKPTWTNVGCAGYPCQRGVFSNVTGTWTCVAQLYRGSGWAVLTKSVTFTYGGAATGASQLIFEVGDKRVAINFSLEADKISETERCWRGGTMTRLLSGREVCTGRGDERATATGSTWTSAVNWTSPVRFNAAVTATAYVNAPLPSGWYLLLICGGNCPGVTVREVDQERVQAVFGPYAAPHPSEGVEAFICRSRDNWCGGLVAAIDINRQ